MWGTQNPENSSLGAPVPLECPCSTSGLARGDLSPLCPTSGLIAHPHHDSGLGAGDPEEYRPALSTQPHSVPPGATGWGKGPRGWRDREPLGRREDQARSSRGRRLGGTRRPLRWEMGARQDAPAPRVSSLYIQEPRPPLNLYFLKSLFFSFCIKKNPIIAQISQQGSVCNKNSQS